jgi:hypothetical protein
MAGAPLTDHRFGGNVVGDATLGYGDGTVADAYGAADADFSGEITLLPTSVVPASPTWARSNVSRPMVQLWPTWTRLSIFASRPIRVSPMLPRSMQCWPGVRRRFPRLRRRTGRSCAKRRSLHFWRS